MRRALTMLAPLVLVLAAVSPVSAAPPTKVPDEPFSNDFLPGETCDFAVRIESTAINSKTTTFNRKDGRLKENLTGKIIQRVTNLETGASVVRNSSGPGKVTLNAAGHVVLRFGGASVLTFFDGDVIGRGVLYVKGGGAEFEIGDDGFFFVRVQLPAHVEDLCATLAPAA